MKGRPLELSKEQWAFMAVLDALGGNVPIDVVSTLVPLLPGPFADLLLKTAAHGWIKKIGTERLAFGPNLPENALKHIKEINNAKHLPSSIDCRCRPYL
jgi:hypothetical protein